MRVSATLQRLRNTEAENEKRTRIVVSTPKSETSMRTIPLTDQTSFSILIRAGSTNINSINGCSERKASGRA